ncbi:MAG: cell division protein FtsZ [Deltaproteobacteria bacterium]|nr:cell division protein FtsZ [Myxococcales bacterium]MDP3213234.1 cell division protein FtsZ [Deltaproteobacteria bacterium]
MGLSFDLVDNTSMAAARIKVVGVGGAGGNAIRTMIESQVTDVEFVVANTDIQALMQSPADVKIQLGRALTKGLGAGANPDVGKRAAMEDIQLIQEHLQGADMVFVTAGMGGGTGTGAASVIAQVARDLGALTVGVVTKPFKFEGTRRSKFAMAGLAELGAHVDTLITIPNDKLLALDDDMTMTDSFRKADEVLVNAVQGISDLIQQSGLINVDFADVKAVMSGAGLALMGIGYGRGDTRAMDAARAAISSPLLDNISVDGATGVLINFMGGPDLRLREVNEAASMIQESAGEDANIIFGAVINENMRDVVKVTIIATGFPSEVAAFDARAISTSMPMVHSRAPTAHQPQRSAYQAPVPAQVQARHAQAQQAMGGRASAPPSMPNQMGRSTRPMGTVSMKEDEFDIPTFLRHSRNPGGDE